MGRRPGIAGSVIEEACRGNMIALGIIVENYSGYIEKRIHEEAPGLTGAAVQDCRQEVCIELLRLIPQKFKVTKRQ